MEENKKNEYNQIEAKVILLGEAGVGKTSLIKATIGEEFDPNEISTSTASIIKKEFQIDKIKYIINLWDTAGQEKYKSLTKLFFKGSDIAILVYDITSQESFKNLDYWVDVLNENKNSDSKCIFGIVGNKSDMVKEQEVDENEVTNYANTLGVKHKLVSAKVDPDSFIDFLRELVKDARKNLSNRIGKIFLNIQNNKNHKCKC